jgi:acetyl-CoA C-acetyltransferase
MPIVIASAVRTPIASFQGALAPLSAPRLGSAVLHAALVRAGVAPGEVDAVLMGQVLTAGAKQGPARQAALGAGLPDSVPAVTLNKMCGSGLESVIQAMRMLALGDARVVLAGGMESMTNAPYLLPGARQGMRLGDSPTLDSILADGLLDAFDGRHMGIAAEWAAETFALSRAAQDAYAIRSYRRAQAATANGVAAREIVPVEVPGRKGVVTLVEHDEGPARVDFEKLPTLRPAFTPSGTITAANASSINDGAAALLLTTEATARAAGWPVRARILGAAGHAQAPQHFTGAPIGAMERLFARAGLNARDVEVFEINEAFAVVPLAAMQAFELDPERVNILGGAIALGHPIGASGARILVTLLNALEERDAQLGMASICIGGGEGLALALERV